MPMPESMPSADQSMHRIISIMYRMGGALLVLALGSESAIAATNVPIANPGFEADVLSPGFTSRIISGWDVDDFSGNDGDDGVFRPTSTNYPSGPPEGLNLAYVNHPENRIGQTLTSTLRANTTYVWLSPLALVSMSPSSDIAFS